MIKIGRIVGYVQKLTLMTLQGEDLVELGRGVNEALCVTHLPRPAPSMSPQPILFFILLTQLVCCQECAARPPYYAGVLMMIQIGLGQNQAEHQLCFPPLSNIDDKVSLWPVTVESSVHGIVLEEL
jgi:hypothetical protein